MTATKMKKTIGVLGGMGPEATNYFFDLLIKHTAATSDQEYIPTLLWSDPGIPPRSDAIFGKGPSPLPRLLEGVVRLERAGAHQLGEVLAVDVFHGHEEEAEPAAAGDRQPPG
jgi:aspartate racemase